MSSNIVFEGWLTKSPPSKRIWRTKWRRRWFALRQSCELPGQYFLDYYADRNCRRLKGTINLDLCEQVDAGLHMARAGNGTLDPKLRGSVFTIQTQSRTYHLEADCEADMAQWVDAICKVCGLRPAEDESNETYQNTANVSRASNNGENALTTGPYIPISECITGVRNQDQQTTQKTMCDKSTETCGPRIYIPPQIKITTVDSENESNLSDEDSKSLNASQTNIPDWSVTKSFTKLAVNANKNEVNEDGPPVPPRPPKTFAKKKDVQKETFQGPKIQEPVVDSVQESIANYTGPGTPWLRVPRRITYSPVLQPPERQKSRNYYTLRPTDDDEFNPGIRQLPVYDTNPEEVDVYNPNIQHIFVTKKKEDKLEERPMYRTRHDQDDPEIKQPMHRTRHDQDDPVIKQPMYRTGHDQDDPENNQPAYTIKRAGTDPYNPGIRLPVHKARRDDNDPYNSGIRYPMQQPAYRTRCEGNDPYNPGIRQPMCRTRHDQGDPEIKQPMYRTRHDADDPEIKLPMYRTRHDADDPEIKQPMYRTRHDQDDPEIKQPMYRTRHDADDPEIKQSIYRTRHDQDDPEIKQPMYRTRHDQDDPEIKQPMYRTRHDEDDPENNTQYCNLPSLPPAVDRALKPRHSSHSIGHINNYMVQDDVKPESLQYLDLDLQSSAPSFKNAGYPQRLDIIHGKSYSGVESECVYKTVDFLKTEAFNMTRQDAEAFRSHQY